MGCLGGGSSRFTTKATVRSAIETLNNQPQDQKIIVNCSNKGERGGVNRVYLEADSRVYKRKTDPKTYTYLQEPTSK